MRLKSLLNTSKEFGTRAMTSDESFTFMQLTAMEMENPDWRMAEEDANSPWVVIMKDRLFKSGCDATDHLVFFISSLCTCHQHAIMWGYTICHIQERSGARPTLDLMSMRFFPSGTPSDEAYQKCWEAQKTDDGAHNMMDWLANWWG
jgi:hypothetical protein